jgi:hypothetical protein
MTAEGFAEGQGVTASHVRAILRGDRESVRLTDAMRALIAKHLPGAEGGQ